MYAGIFEQWACTYNSLIYLYVVPVYRANHLRFILFLISNRESMSKDKIRFGSVKGDVIAGKVSGTGNIVGKKVVVNQQTIQHLHPEFAKSIKAFSGSIDNLLEEHSVPEIQVERINHQIDELAKEVKDIPPDVEAPYVKQSSIKAKIAGIADTLFKVLPSAAETAASFTPLAPFGKVIGESIEGIVKAVRGE